MISLKINSWHEIKQGSHKGRFLVSSQLIKDEYEMTAEELSKKFLGKVGLVNGKKYNIKGVENVRFFIPDTPPAIGMMLEEIKN